MSILRDMVRHGIASERASTIDVWRIEPATVRRVPIYALGALEPTIAGDAFIHPDAVVIGSVTIGSESSVWPCAVLRGDEGEIRIGDQTSVQDCSVLHTTPLDPTVVGSRCVVGHIVHLEACIIEDDVLVGNGSIVLHRAVARSWSIIAANSVVLNDTEIPSGAIAAGSPASIKLDRAKPDLIRSGVAAYVERAKRFRADLRRLD
jgi:carbonic anhydrase/acetyltransferase-like protein (isoleucine patch superfamily)